MRARVISAVAIAMAVSAIVVVAAASGGSSATSVPGGEGLELVRQSTKQYQDVNAAIAAGYVQFFGCVHEPLSGSMGIHFVNGALARDATVAVSKPEAVIYEQHADGTLHLVGVEYVVFKDAWDAHHTAPPRLFGRTFMATPAGNRFGIPAFYSLHAWAWKANPTGAFEMWNPTVLCPGAEGHTTG
jgi:hypothetical protein